MDLRQLKDKALEHAAKRRFDKAAQLYAEICQAEPKDLQARQRWGDALRAAGKPKEAVDVYKSVADAYARDGQLLKAIAVNKLLLEVDPNHTETQRILAELYALRAPAKPASVPRPLVSTSPSAAAPSALASAAQPGPISVPRTVSSTEIPIDLSDSGEFQGERLETSSELELPAESLSPPPGEGARAEAEELAGQAGAGAFDEGEQPLAAELEDDPLEATAADPAMTETVTHIPDSPLFESLDSNAFVDLLHRCKRRVFAVGDRLIQQGEPARSFFVVSTGVLSVVQAPTQDPTSEVELARLGPGDFFGELALVSESPRIASVVARLEGEALEFPGDVLTGLIAAHPAAEAAVRKFARARLLQNAMATSALFRPFDRDQRKHLIARFVIREVPAKTAVLAEGQPSDGLYIVMQGTFGVVRGEQRLATLSVGEIFGEISLLTRAEAGASVIAESAGRVLRLPRKAFDELILTHPQVLEMVSTLAEERQQLNEGIVSGKVACDTQGLILI